MPTTIQLVHRNGDTYNAEVYGIVHHPPRLIIRWSVSGTYDIDLETGLLLKSGGRIAVLGWRAADLYVVRSLALKMALDERRESGGARSVLRTRVERLGSGLRPISIRSAMAQRGKTG